MNKKSYLLQMNLALFSHRLEIINSSSKLYDTFIICKNNQKEK